MEPGSLGQIPVEYGRVWVSQVTCSVADDRKVSLPAAVVPKPREG